MPLTSATRGALPRCLKVIAVSDEDAQLWLTHAYGEHVALNASGLPSELRTSLYPDLFAYGPAAEKVAMFLSVLIANRKNAQLHGLLKAIDSDSIFHSKSAYSLFYTNWGDGRGYRGLLLNLENALEPVVTLRDGAVDSGMYLTAFMLTGQYLLSLDEAQQFQSLVRRVNRVLRFCGMEPLGGVFSRARFLRGRRNKQEAVHAS